MADTSINTIAFWLKISFNFFLFSQVMATTNLCPDAGDVVVAEVMDASPAHEKFDEPAFVVFNGPNNYGCHGLDGSTPPLVWSENDEEKAKAAADIFNVKIHHHNETDGGEALVRLKKLTHKELFAFFTQLNHSKNSTRASAQVNSDRAAVQRALDDLQGVLVPNIGVLIHIANGLFPKHPLSPGHGDPISAVVFDIVEFFAVIDNLNFARRQAFGGLPWYSGDLGASGNERLLSQLRRFNQKEGLDRVKQLFDGLFALQAKMVLSMQLNPGFVGYSLADIPEAEFDETTEKLHEVFFDEFDKILQAYKA